METDKQPTARVRVQAHNEALEPGHEGWPKHRALLFDGIRGEGGLLQPALPDESGERTKGIPDFFYLSLPPTAIAGVFHVIKIWLRERGRVIVFEVSKGGETTTWRFTGPVSDATLREVLNHAIGPDNGTQANI